MGIYELWSKLLKGGYIGDYIGDYYRGYKGDTRSFDYSSYGSRSYCHRFSSVRAQGVGLIQ